MKPLSRRAFLAGGTLCLAAHRNRSLLAAETRISPLFRAGLMTDLHYADKGAANTRQLPGASGPAIILAHQRLDNSPAHGVKNAAALRSVLEKSGKVLAVFQGHSHKNDYQQIGGIHYVTLVAMVEGPGLENSGYTLLDVMPDHSVRLHGFRRQTDRDLRRAS